MKLPERPLGDAIRLNLMPVDVSAGTNYPIAGLYSFGRGFIRRPTIDGSETAYSRLFRISKDQLVMSKLGAWEGAFAVVPDEFDGAFVSPEYPSFDIDSSVATTAYIAHLVRWPAFWERVNPRGSMARRKRITPARLAEIAVPLPDLEEQRRIASRLDAAEERLKEVGRQRDYSIKLHDSLRESMFSNEQLGEPARLGDVLTLERIPAIIDPEENYTQIGIRSFGKGIFHRDGSLGSELSKLKYYEIRPGNLIVSNIMAWEGAIAVSSEADNGCIGSHRFLSFKPTESVDIRYLSHFFQSRQGRELIKTTSTGTVLRNQTLSIKHFENLKVPLPPIGEQKRVASILERSNVIQGRVATQGELSNTLTRSLLHAAFSGKL
ncbi:restriction endonuclease subunit S [Actinomadura litoris]|uniref:Type I restriction modification DNA specificity domain-containing protein n=1 Tax=Actinomadura litoris TaxID=2678616 RepID=A0A7K1KTA3_9ACTN|nr:restriction endonuclease subunit S [Actinomadura litoris]MUN35402.1 hypothetical protein [Actinomadura litoris]